MKRATRISVLLLTALLMLGSVSSLDAQEITKKRGKVTFHYANGNYASSGRVVNYQKTGTWKYWDEQGVLLHIETYVHDTLHGPYVAYNTDGSVAVFGNYDHGRKNGLWRYYYANGQPSAENSYVDGNLDGRQVAWYENGQVSEITFCSNGQLLSKRAWYPGGELRLVETYKNGVSEGRWVSYPDPASANDTFPAVVDEYADGKRNGWHYAFSDGKKTEQVHYVADEANGDCSRWDEHGHIQAEEHFTAGKRDGCCKYYNCNGLLRCVNYVQGEQTGPQVDYNRDGDTLNITWYTYGVRDSMKTFHPNGATATRWAYARAADNTEQSEYTEWDPEGVKLVYGRCNGSVKYGEWYTYYADGTKKSITTYSNGEMNGPYVKFYPNGKRMIEYNILPDSSTTSPLVWTETGRPMRPGTQKYNEIIQSSKPGETYNDPIVSRPSIDKSIAEATPSHMQYEAIEVPEAPASPEVSDAEDNTVYMNPDVMPSFPGGAAAMQDFLDDNLVHPASLVHMQGTVFISYIVEKDGSISEISPVQEVKGGPEFTKEALRVVQSFPRMEPAMKDGKPVRCKVILPVQFNSN